jgi:hypothetical protein
MAVHYIALVLLILIPIGIPLLFGVLLYLNRSRLNPKVKQGMTIDVFEGMVESIVQHKVPDKEMRAMFHLVDIDNSGEIEPGEFAKFTIERALTTKSPPLGPSRPLGPLSQDVDMFIPSIDRTAAEMGNKMQMEIAKHHGKKKWWEGDKNQFRFLTKAYEDEFYYFEVIHPPRDSNPQELFLGLKKYLLL